MQTSCIFVASSFVIDPQILIFSVFNIASFPILIANKIFGVTVLLFIYSRDQFVASEICHSRRHCSVCQWSTWYSVTRTRLWQKHINTHIIHSYTCKGIKIGALKMQFVCIFFHIWLSLNICRKFEFFISQGSVATCLRWGGRCHTGFVANFIRFLAVQNFENRLRFDKVSKLQRV